MRKNDISSHMRMHERVLCKCLCVKRIAYARSGDICGQNPMYTVIFVWHRHRHRRVSFYRKAHTHTHSRISHTRCYIPTNAEFSCRLYYKSYITHIYTFSLPPTRNVIQMRTYTATLVKYSINTFYEWYDDVLCGFWGAQQQQNSRAVYMYKSNNPGNLRCCDNIAHHIKNTKLGLAVYVPWRIHVHPQNSLEKL